ncbi:MAG TPA: FAD-dependent oxidoreductase [Solirubrobacteraceae bacterium]|jgi:3-phenylpropionate/trans-cinnamate dioxygenase ferredoxin reductase component
MSKQTFVILGASLAGAKAAAELRERGFDGRVVLVGAESERPYERPPLSKEYLQGKSERQKAYVHDEGFYDQQDIELRLGTAAESIDPASATVSLAGGEELPYDALLLTTGAQPRVISVPGAELDGVHYLRTFDDCDALRARLGAGSGRVAVVGAGWIGSEFAASARSAGLDVTVIDPLALPNERVFGAEVGAFYRDVHLSHGVEMVLEDGVDRLEGDGSVSAVRTASGRRVECDFAVIGVGVIPRVGLAEAAGLTVENGVQVDAALKTSAANVFAAGDVANAWHPFYDRHIRVEHWANALNQGPAAARSMLGEAVSYDRIPYFYSDQYDVGMEYSGYTTAWDEVVFRGDREGGEFVAFYLADGRVVAGMNVNVWDVNEHVQALIRSRRRVDADALRDTDTPLESLAGKPAG